MPLASVNYSGGIIITDWYSEQGNAEESIKITIRFLSNEVRSDAIDVDVFYKKCIATNNCKINKQDGQLKKEITKLTENPNYWGTEENIDNENEIFHYVLTYEIVNQDWFDDKLKYTNVELLEEILNELNKIK